MNGDATKDSFNDELMQPNHIMELKPPKVDQFNAFDNQVKSPINGLGTNTSSTKFKSPPDTETDFKAKKKALYVKLIKKVNPEIKDINELWRQIAINDLISEQKLLKAGVDEILYSGDLFKCIHKAIIRDSAYSPIFVILTKAELTYI
jgi:hypothetical protein